LNIIDSNFPKTNNAIEGWHNTFANTFANYKHSFYLLIKKLKDEEDVIRIRSIQIDELNMVFKRKNKYINKERRLNDFLERKRNNEVGLEFMFELVELLSY
jgi:hypothetical protein